MAAPMSTFHKGDRVGQWAWHSGIPRPTGKVESTNGEYVEVRYSNYRFPVLYRADELEIVEDAPQEKP